MRSVRTLRTGTVAGVIAWKLAALALLPAAFCCQAVLADGGGALPCCEGRDHGDFCPLNRADRDGASDADRLQACESFDDALLGLLGLTGFTPEPPATATPPAASGLLARHAHAPVPLDHTPPSPPPRL